MLERTLKEKITEWLFTTGAVKVAPADAPFWYTSGLIGPYYVNTHFLIGSERVANELLNIMDTSRQEPLQCAALVHDFLQKKYVESPVFKEVIDALTEKVKQENDWESIEYIAGGERRDWFFSIPVASALNRPHIAIFKDRQTVLADQDELAFCPKIPGARVFHISDLVTEASSYLRAWLPALRDLGATMEATLTVIDRCQGGAAALQQEGIPFSSLVRIEPDLFSGAASCGYITYEQAEVILSYLADPYGSMRQFLLDNPKFLKDALRAEERTRQRARLLTSLNLYDLDFVAGMGN